MTPSSDGPDLASAAIAAASDAIVTVNGQGVITSWNGAATEVFGHPAAEAVGQSLALIVPAQHRSRHVAGFHAAVSSGSLAHGGRPGRVVGLTASGRMVGLHMTLGLLFGESGEVNGVVAVLRPDGNAVSFI